MGPIVIACNSGGPLESIEHDATGFLLKPESKLWADQIFQIINDEFKVSFDAWLDEGESGEGKDMKKLTVENIKRNGKARVEKMFTE